jgi:hypothetical protein
LISYQKQFQNTSTIENLADLKDGVQVFGTCTSQYNSALSWELQTTWEEIFSLISPYILENPNDDKVEGILAKSLFNISKNNRYAPHIDNQLYQTIKIQLEVLGLIITSYKQSIQGTMALFLGF